MCRFNVEPPKAQENAPSCPFTLHRLNDTTYLIRENDCHGEYPHIYVKKYSEKDDQGNTLDVLIINDTGVGTKAPNPDTSTSLSSPSEWNIKTFIDHHFNPTNQTPYLIILSHCHFDHILGIPFLLSNPNTTTTTESPFSSPSPQPNPTTTILSSSHSPTFLTPHTVLAEHSLCTNLSLPTPHYKTTLWAPNKDSISYPHPLGPTLTLPITTLHTPGHTPDSLSWYDAHERTLYVGDSIYTQQSDDTKSAPWGPERAAPIVFTNESDLVEWWRSLDALIVFVTERNEETVGGGSGGGGEVKQRVKLSAGHVTANIDAFDCLMRVKGFVARVLREEVKFVEWEVRRGERFGLWSDGKEGEFSVAAPVRIIEEGRRGLQKVKGEGLWERGV